jgi:hypothetical protein
VATLAAVPVVSAQSFERGWVDVNVGVAKAAGDAFSMGFTGTLFSEPAEFDASYKLPTGAAFDFGGGVMFNRYIGAGVSFTGTAHEDKASLFIRIPHPLYNNAFATDTAPTQDKFMRTEGGVNLQAMAVVAQTDRLRVRVFGGPSYFRVKQEQVSDIRYNQVYQILSRGNAVGITTYDRTETEDTGWGFHAGGDVSVFFTRVIGVGGFARFSRATVEMEDALGVTTIDVKAGGFQTGGGLRLKF